jgi:hypothetical protein
LHGYDTAFWWTAGTFAGGAVLGGILLRREPLVLRGAPGPQATSVRKAGTKASPGISA